MAKEWHAFTIALIVIGAFVVFFGYALFKIPQANITIETVREVVALMGGYVAAVLIYYFGQKQTTSANERAEQAVTDRETMKNKLETAKPKAQLEIESAEEQIQNAEERLRNFMKSFGIE